MSDYERWIEAYLDGELGQEDAARLEAWLREDPEHMRIFVRASHADTATRDAVGAGPLACPTCPEPGTARAPWWRGRFAGLAAAVILLNLGGLIWIQYSLTRVPVPTVRVLSVSPTADADLADRVTVKFDRDLVAPELTGKVQPAALFELSPAWPGQWAWGGADTLEYRLDKPLPPGRKFHLTAAGDLATRTGKELQGEREFAIRTRALALTNMEVKACDNRTATLELTFNQPVEPGELLRHMRARDGKDNTVLNEGLCLTKIPAATLVVQFDRPASEELKVTLDKALAGSNGELPLGKEIVKTFSVTSRFVLMNVAGEPGSLSEPGEVRVHFSHPLGTQEVQVAVDPAVAGLKVEQTKRYFLRLRGGFEPGKTYTITVPGTIVDEHGQALGQACVGRVEIPAMAPQVSFLHGQGVLSPMGALEVDLDVLNVKEVAISSWRLHENNLASYLRDRHGAEYLGRIGPEKIVKLDAPRNRAFRTAVTLPGVLEGACGVYRVHAKVAGQWDGDETVVTLTDLALTVKKQRGGLLVWVTSLRTAQPVAEATVKAVSANNQTLAAMKTDKDGLARLVVPEKHPDGECWLVTAQKGPDLAYLLPEDNAWVVDNVAQDGRPYATGYEVMAYTDRGVYRPGEEVFVTGLIRDGAGAIPPAFPLTVKVIRPDGRTAADLPVTPGEGAGGFFHVTYPTAGDGQTGPYRFQVALPGSNEVIGETHAQVEAFLPVRMEVKASATAGYYGPGQKPRVNVSARYLWDQPGSGLPVKLEPALTPKRFASPAHVGWQFGTKLDSATISFREPQEGSEENSRDGGILAGNLNAKGESSFDVALPDKLAKGFYTFSAAATVTDARSVSATAKADVDTVGLHVGLRSPKDLAAVGEAVPVEWVRLTGQGADAAPGEMKTRLVRVEYDSVLKRAEGGGGRRHGESMAMVWESVERLIDVKAGAIPAAGASGKIDVACPEGGHYRLIVTDVGTGSETWLDLYTAGGQSVSMEKPERVEIVTDQPKYLPGATAKVLIRSAVPGTLLLTLETDSVVGYFLGEVKDRTAEMEVPIPASVRGGAFLTATVIRPVDPSATSWLPHRAMGMARLAMDHKAGELPVVVKAPEKARPLEAVTVTVETGAPSDPARPTMVHLWAVDEGILLCAGYVTPDVRGFFFDPRSPGVETADSFFRLLPDFARPASVTRIGAGDDSRGPGVDSLRRNPVPTRQRTPAVVWRTVAPADAAGKLAVEIKLPDRIGQMRFMAVAADGDRYGRAQQATTVTSPLIVEATWPRFAAPGDTFDVPVKVFNSTDKPMTVRLRAQAAGPVTVKNDPALEKVTIAPGEPASLTLAASAGGVGSVETTVVAEQLDAAAPERAECKFNFPVRPGTGLHTDVQLVAVPAGKPMTLATPATFAGGPVRTRVQVSVAPGVQLAAAMEKLVGYPYGCVEQTSSKLMGLLYAADVMDESRAAGVGEMINAGIARLWSMQTTSGGLGYWPGAAQADEWGTTYAATVLAEARAAGHKVDPRFSDALVKYLMGVLRTPETKDADLNVRAAACRVLAVFGKPAEGWMAHLAESKDKLDLAGRVDLAAAFYAIGRKDRASALLPDQPTTVGRSTGQRLVSQVRAEGMWLLMLLENDAQNPLIAQLAGRLDQARQGKAWWGTTLDNAAAVAGLARYQATMAGKAAPNFAGSVRIGQEEPVAFTHAKGAAALSQAGGEVVIAAQGTGTVYAVVTREGLAAQGVVKPYDRELTVRRKWVDSSGKPVAPNALRVGDLVYVEVSLCKPGGPDVHNVAVVDALPGATEVENPALATSSSAAVRRGDRAWSAPDHVEFLDDRVVLFCTAGKEESTFRYALRVTTAGQFALPPIQASCMYDPAAASMGESGRVKAEK